MKKNNEGEFIIDSLESLDEFAALIACLAKEGDVYSLEGEMGAGKTTFAQYLLAHLGVKERVTSPTYSIVSTYLGTAMDVYHADVYRIDDEEELYNMGFEDYISPKAIFLVEWGDKFTDYLLDNCNNLTRIAIRLDGKTRYFKLSGNLEQKIESELAGEKS